MANRRFGLGWAHAALHWREALLVTASVVVSLLALEAGYRLFHYATLPGRLYRLVDAQVPALFDPKAAVSAAQQYVPDEHTGYVYTPNYEGSRGAPWHSRWRTNSHGHVSQFEYPRAKPAGEFRIAVVGDSMTANITNNVRWTEVLETELNTSSSWQARVGNRFTRVINFGVDGMGMVQFAAMVRHRVMEFEPDLVLVNFISDDILRRKRFPSVPAAGSREDSIRAYVQQNFLDHITWLGRCPELPNALFRPGRSKRCRLPLDPRLILAAGPAFHFSTRQEAIATGTAAVNDMMSVAPNILFLQMPLHQEFYKPSFPQWRGLVDDLRQAVPQAPIVSMLAHIPEARRIDLDRWFFQDGHYTDFGTTRYAHEVARHLIGSDILGAITR